MGQFLDLLTGDLLSIKSANGADINSVKSDKLIVTPKALGESDLFCNTSIPLVLPSVFTTKSMLFVVNTNVFLIPTNGSFFPIRQAKIKAQLFSHTIVDAGLIGELCIVDIAANKIVANSTTAFKNTTYTCIASNNTFELEAGKAYSVALRRASGNPAKSVSLRAAILTLKLLSV